MKRILLSTLLVLLMALPCFAASGDGYAKAASAVTAAYTNAYGGAVGDLAADEAWDWTSDITWSTWAEVRVYLEHDSAGTTDNIILGIRTVVDGDDPDNPGYQIEFDATAGTDTQEDFVTVYPCAAFQVGVKTSGTTDTFDYRIRYVPIYWYLTP